MTAVLEGVGLIVFTGGIGENDVEALAVVCAHSSCSRISLDEAQNRPNARLVSDPVSRCKVFTFPSQEDEQIGRRAWALPSGGHS